MLRSLNLLLLLSRLLAWVKRWRLLLELLSWVWLLLLVLVLVILLRTGLVSLLSIIRTWRHLLAWSRTSTTVISLHGKRIRLLSWADKVSLVNRQLSFRIGSSLRVIAWLRISLRLLLLWVQRRSILRILLLLGLLLVISRCRLIRGLILNIDVRMLPILLLLLLLVVLSLCLLISLLIVARCLVHLGNCLSHI